MKTHLLRLALVVALAFAALALVAPAAADEGAAVQAEGSSHDVVPAAVWSLVGAAVGAAVLGTLYLFKRRVGGFPKHPTWTAPISVMRSRDLPGDEPNGHGDSHDAHGGTGHAPAH